MLDFSAGECSRARRDTLQPETYRQALGYNVPMRRFFLCHYHEIGLKKGNRSFFEKRLLQNIHRALSGLPFKEARRISGRLIVELLPESPVKEIGEKLQKVFGIVLCSPAWLSEQDLDLLQQNLWSLVQERDFESFKIQARRAQKTFPLNSPQLNERLGAFILERCGKRVDLGTPELTCYVDIVERYAFLYFEKLSGVKGLPVGSSGKVVVLLSGGIDSPVASYKIMKRGCQAIFVHFHSFPHTSTESQEKVRKLVTLLSQYQFRSVLYRVPFAEVQRQIVAFTPASTRVIFYRRFMLRLAQQIASREGGLALVTGDSIGQVASQTLENISVISESVRLPVLRPLVGEDKEDIIEVARKIGSYPISILPEEDCCSLFVPRHPETRADQVGINRIEEQLDLDEALSDALKRTEREVIESNFNVDVPLAG